MFKKTLWTIMAALLMLVPPAIKAADEDCPIPSDAGVVFLPKTTAPRNLLPFPAAGEDFPRDCEFYKWAWQEFLFSTQPDAKGNPAFKNYMNFGDVFKRPGSPLFAPQQPGVMSLAPRTPQFRNENDPGGAPIDDFLQATVNAILVDQKGDPIFYALHMNPTFVSFIEDYHLNTVPGLTAAPAELEFRVGSVEFKSAWAIVDDPKSWKDYFVVEANVPVFKNSNGKIVPGGAVRRVKVALLALHVVGVIEGHPEFIWATFEHVQRSGAALVRDNAPAAINNPDQPSVKLSLNANRYRLYPGGSASGPVDSVPNANKPVFVPDLKLNETTQKFSPSTPIYRMYPSSQASVQQDPKTPPEDPEIVSLNGHVQQLFEKVAKNDLRANYQLVAAVWLNTPRGLSGKGIPPDFKEGQKFSNNSHRDPPVLAGEDRLSSTAMESFTQDENDQNGNAFPNCFSCHDTRAIGGAKGLKDSRLNVSHMLSRFIALANH